MQYPLEVYSDKVIRSLNDAIMVSRLSHWNVRGSNFYEAHQLFGRIYDELSEFTDGLVETLRAFEYSPSFQIFSGPDISLESYDCHYLANLTLDYIMTLSGTLSVFFEYCEENKGRDPRIIGLSNHLQNISDSVLSDMYLLQAFLGS